MKTEFSISFMISLKCVYKASNRKVPKLWGEKGLTERPKAMQLLAGRLEKCSPFHSSGLFTRLSGSHFRLKLSYHRRRSGLKFLKPSQCREFSWQIVPSSIFSWGPYPLNPPPPTPNHWTAFIPQAGLQPTVCLAVYLSLSTALFITLLFLSVWMTKLWLIFWVLF